MQNSIVMLVITVLVLVVWLKRRLVGRTRGSGDMWKYLYGKRVLSPRGIAGQSYPTGRLPVITCCNISDVGYRILPIMNYHSPTVAQGVKCTVCTNSCLCERICFTLVKNVYSRGGREYIRFTTDSGDRCVARAVSKECSVTRA